MNNKGIAVKYSRETDVFIGLAERAQMANEWGADLFISIHTNAYDGNSYGTECYIHPNDTSETKQLSINVANTISSELGLYNRGHKEADFAVLRLSNMPAILIETAFIDNEEEGIILKEKSDEFANAIYKAITGEKAEDLKIILKVAGIIIPVGQYITISAKPTWLYSWEITAEYQVPPELLPEKFKHHPVYARVVIDIIKSNRFDRLYLPAQTTKTVHQIEEGAGADWKKLLIIQR